MKHSSLEYLRISSNSFSTFPNSFSSSMQLSVTQCNSLSPLLFLSPVSLAQHNVSRCGNTKSQFLSPFQYLSHLHVPGLSDISDVERNLSELSVTSSVDSGFKGSGHSFRLHAPGSPVRLRCKCTE